MSTPTSLTVAQVAARYGVSARLVLAWIATGQLIAISVARSPRARRPTWRITATSLAAFEAARATSAPPTPRPRRRPPAGDVIQWY